MERKINRKKQPTVFRIDEVEYLKPKKISLDNGIETFVFESDDIEVVSMSFLFDAGIAFSTKKLLALYANSLYKETPEGKPVSRTAEFFDYYACLLNGFVGNRTAGLKIVMPLIYAKRVIPFLAQLIQKPAIPENEYNILAKIKYEKIKQSLQKTKYLALKGINNQLFGDKNPFGTIISPEDAHKLCISDIRDFVYSNYTSKSCKIIIAGKYNNQIAGLINENFGKSKWGKQQLVKHISNIKESSEKYRIELKKDALQSSVFLGKHLKLKKNDDIHSISVLNTILGGYFGSRLMKNIREEKAYTYGIGSFVTVFPQNPVIRIATDVGTEYTNATIDEILKEIKLLCTIKVGVKELETVKRYMIGDILSSLNGSFQTAMVCERLIESKFGFEYMDREIESINTISPEQIIDAANEYLKTEDIYISVAGMNNIS